MKTLSPIRRESILAAAYALIDADGLEGASMDRIAREAGVSKTTLYNYYPSKEELLRAVIVRYATSFLTRSVEDLVAAEDSPEPLEAKLKTFARHVLDFLYREKSVGRFYRLIVGASVHSDVGRIFRSAGPEEAMQAVAAYLKRRMDAGELAPADPYVRSRQLMAIIRSETDAYLLSQDFSDFRPEDVEAMSARAAAFFVEGAKARPEA